MLPENPHVKQVSGGVSGTDFLPDTTRHHLPDTQQIQILKKVSGSVG